MTQSLNAKPAAARGRAGRTRILICEDETLFRGLLVSSLSACGTIEVVGAVENGDQAIAMAEQTTPDVVLMDIELGEGIDGIKAAHQIKAADPTVGIVILSMHRDKQYLASLPDKRAAGWSFMLKQSIRDSSALVRAIEGASWGLVSIDPAVVERLRPRKRSVLERLTHQQLLILEHLAGGYTDAAVAQKIGINEPAMLQMVDQLYEDLGIPKATGVDPRVKAVLLYLRETSSRS